MRSHSCGLDFVAGGAHPSGVVGQSLTLLSLQTRLHLAPPLADDDGRWGRRAQTGKRRRVQFAKNNKAEAKTPTIKIVPENITVNWHN